MIPPQVGKSRPRKYCEKCRPPRKKTEQTVTAPVVSLPTVDATALPAERPPSLVSAYQARLTAADRLETPEGALVMELAALLASRASSASGAASLSRELRAAMDVAMAGAPREADKVDELSARRIAKATGA